MSLLFNAVVLVGFHLWPQEYSVMFPKEIKQAAAPYVNQKDVKKMKLFLYGLYMTQFSTGDLSHMPYTHIYYGSKEVLSAAADRLVEAFRRDGSECELHIGEGLFHCYPAIDFFPETREAFNEIVGYLS